MKISFLKHMVPDLSEVGIPVVQKMRIVGVIFNDRLTWDDHINHLICQIIPLLRSLAKLRRFNLSKDAMLTYYKTHMRPILEYACLVWHADHKTSTTSGSETSYSHTTPERYRKSFWQYFTTHFNLQFYILRLFILICPNKLFVIVK